MIPTSNLTCSHQTSRKMKINTCHLTLQVCNPFITPYPSIVLITLINHQTTHRPELRSTPLYGSDPSQDPARHAVRSRQKTNPLCTRIMSICLCMQPAPTLSCAPVASFRENISLISAHPSTREHNGPTSMSTEWYNFFFFFFLT